MKNLLLKISLTFIASFIFIGGVAFVNAQNATDTNPENTDIAAQANNLDAKYQYRGYGMGMMDGKWDFNQDGGHYYKNQVLKDILPGFAPLLVGAGIVLSIVGLLLLAFWVWMLVHAVRHDIDYKPVWILVLWFMSILGAIIYYFAVKKQCPCCSEWAECCCGDEGCGCKEDVKEEVVIVEEKKEE